MSAHILLAEDEKNLREGLIDTLESEGYQVTAAADGQQALAAYEAGTFNLVILDVMMPEMSGYDVCRAIRKTESSTPILMLTAKGEEIDKVVGLELGADDYVTKPFGIRELLARIAALLRRAAQSSAPDDKNKPETFTFGAAEINRRQYKATLGKNESDLTARELDLLETFLSRPNEVLSRDDLLNAVWGIDYFGTTRTLDQHIAQLRKKIESDVKNPSVIVTVHGIGYRYQTGA